MKKLFLAAVFLAGCVQAQDESVEQYARRLQEIIVSGDTDRFVALPCFPSECVSQHVIDSIFGGEHVDDVPVNVLNKPGYVRALLSKASAKIKVFGPDRDVYSIVYYDPGLVKFNGDGTLSPSDREGLWWNGYVETLITLKGGRWAFYWTPFYEGAHLPWVGDYG